MVAKSIERGTGSVFARAVTDISALALFVVVHSLGSRTLDLVPEANWRIAAEHRVGRELAVDVAGRVCALMLVFFALARVMVPARSSLTHSLERE